MQLFFKKKPNKKQSNFNNKEFNSMIEKIFSIPDVIDAVFSYLSVKDKLSFRETCSYFKNNFANFSPRLQQLLATQRLQRELRKKIGDIRHISLTRSCNYDVVDMQRIKGERFTLGDFLSLAIFLSSIFVMIFGGFNCEPKPYYLKYRDAYQKTPFYLESFELSKETFSSLFCGLSYLGAIGGILLLLAMCYTAKVELGRKNLYENLKQYFLLEDMITSLGRELKIECHHIESPYLIFKR